MATIVPTVNSVGDVALTNSIIDKSITEIQDELVTDIRENAFYNCTALKKAVFGSVSDVADRAFNGCTALTTVDFHTSTPFGDYVFNNCSALTALILRGATVCHAVSGTLQNSGIASGNGYVYVPAALLDAYKAHSAWGQYANQIHPIEGYTVTWMNSDGTVLEVDTGVMAGTIPTYNGSAPVDSVNGLAWAGWSPVVKPVVGNTTYTATFKPEIEEVEIEDDWDTILANIENGTYVNLYSLGNYKPLDLGSEGIINMQIVAFDKEPLADGSGTAAVSWLGLELLATQHRMHSAYPCIGGWEASEMRTYLQNTVRLLIPANVRTKISTVSKTSTAYDSGGSFYEQTTSDDVWIPCHKELGFDIGHYAKMFKGNKTRLTKRVVNTQTATMWWVRFPSSGGNNFYAYKTTGSLSYSEYATYKHGVCLGFCTGRTPT